jgi:hypothetical protein
MRDLTKILENNLLADELKKEGVDFLESDEEIDGIDINE